MATETYDKTLQMSILDLKEEYYKCDDDQVVKKEILKKLIRKKLEEEKIKKQEMARKKSIANSTHNVDNDIQQIMKSQQRKRNLQNIIAMRGKLEDKWESVHTVQIDQRFQEHVTNDSANNKLMERLNCELDFRVNDNRNPNEVMKAYSSVDDGNYKELEKMPPLQNFSSMRLIR